MTTINNESKYYYIRSKNLASTIQFIGSLSYMVFDDKENPEIKKYAFENTDEFQRVLTSVNKLRKQYQ